MANLPHEASLNSLFQAVDNIQRLLSPEAIELANDVFDAFMDFKEEHDGSAAAHTHAQMERQMLEWIEVMTALVEEAADAASAASDTGTLVAESEEDEDDVEDFEDDDEWINFNPVGGPRGGSPVNGRGVSGAGPGDSFAAIRQAIATRVTDGVAKQVHLRPHAPRKVVHRSSTAYSDKSKRRRLMGWKNVNGKWMRIRRRHRRGYYTQPMAPREDIFGRPYVPLR